MILPEIACYPLVLKTGMVFVSIQIFVVEQSWPALLNSLFHRLGGLLRVSNMSAGSPKPDFLYQKCSIIFK